VKSEAIEDVIIVDLDSGECTLHGGAKIKDFIGESGSSLKQATESLERVRSRASFVASSVANMFLGSSKAVNEPVSQAESRCFSTH
jgi:hypothetical protein